MILKEQLGILKDQILYNIHYAPHYPFEDKTSLNKQFNEIESMSLNINKQLRDSQKKSQLQIFLNYIKSAENSYSKADNELGRRQMEEALLILQEILIKNKKRPVLIVSSDGTVNKEK